MRPIDHLISSLDRGSLSREGAEREFFSLCGGLLGKNLAEDLFFRLWERGNPLSIAYGAAFLMGEYDEDTMPLGDADWEDLRETILEAAGSMDINTLQVIMNELLERKLI